jgi:uncharacterized ParB-like nuclease family protein
MIFEGYQTADLATWHGLVDAIDLFEPWIWKQYREPLSPGLKAARDQINALIERATGGTPTAQGCATSEVSQMDRFATIDVVTAAKILGVSVQRVRQLCAEDKLSADKVREAWQINRAGVEILARRKAGHR